MEEKTEVKEVNEVNKVNEVNVFGQIVLFLPLCRQKIGLAAKDALNCRILGGRNKILNFEQGKN